MQPGIPDTSPFVVELLTTLRAEHFSIRAWGRFLKRSWIISCTTARDNPMLKRSWLQVTLLVCILALCLLLATSISEGINTTLRILPGLAICIAWQQSDLFWHLGLNRDSQTGALRQQLGIANTLTALRGLAASILIARLVARLSTSSHLAVTVLVAAIISDILDGQVARRTRTQSRLGQIMDGEVDAALYLALTLVLIQHGSMPGWLGVILLLRYLVPILGALGSYILFARPVRFGSTQIGKIAGIVQGLYFWALLLPDNRLFLAQVIAIPLLALTLGLLIAAASMQIIINTRHPH